MTSDAWLSPLAAMAHAVGYMGFALIVLSMVYSLRKRRWLVKGGEMTKWLWLHHVAGLVGGLLALGHTLGSLRGLGVWIAVSLVVVLATSSVALVEARATAPVRRASAEVGRRRAARDALDKGYRDLLARGTAWTYEGHDIYARLTSEIEAVKQAEAEVERLSKASPRLHWWLPVHIGATAAMFGLVAVHIWAKVALGGVGL